MPGEGPYTRCDLSDARNLLPSKRQGYTRAAMCFALELSRLSYDMDIAPCLDAGWEDVSFQVDDLLLTSFHGKDARARKACLQAAAKARARMEKLDPLSQIKGFRRQKEALDTCKAMVMAKALDDEKTMIVIAFTGTTKRLYEWLSNLRMQEEEGFHAGFLLLTKQFEENAARILFPHTAQRMGFASLSLMDIMQHLRMGSNRFQVFVTGHSQGAALMQIYIHRLMASGVPAERLHGMGFASPSVVNERALRWANYPVQHFINADDLIARVGGRMHIGLCSVLPATQAYRRACYGPKADTPAMRDVLNELHALRDTEEALLFGVAVTDVLSDLPENVSEEVLMIAARGFLPDALAQRLAGYARRVARALSRRLTAMCVRVVGHLDDDKLQTLHSRLEILFERYGAREIMTLIAETLMRPHALAEADGARAYQLLVTEYEKALAPSLWGERAMPVWDIRFEGERHDRICRKGYNRFRPLSTQRHYIKQTGKNK